MVYLLRKAAACLGLSWVIGFAGSAWAEAWLIDIKGAIGPATADHMIRGLEQAADSNAEMVILRIDTPGGLDSAMRDMIKAILAADLPVIGYVAPSGARAASAGTYLYSSVGAALSRPVRNKMVPPTSLLEVSCWQDSGSTTVPGYLFHNSRRFATRVVQHSPLFTDMRLLNCTVPVVLYTSHSRELGKRRSRSSGVPTYLQTTAYTAVFSKQRTLRYIFYSYVLINL